MNFKVMKDNDQNIEEIEATKEIVYTQAQIYSSLTENSGRKPGVELRKPRNMCICVSEERGHGGGLDAYFYSTDRYTNQTVYCLFFQEYFVCLS